MPREKLDPPDVMDLMELREKPDELDFQACLLLANQVLLEHPEKMDLQEPPENEDQTVLPDETARKETPAELVTLVPVVTQEAQELLVPQVPLELKEKLAEALLDVTELTELKEMLDVPETQDVLVTLEVQEPLELPEQREKPDLLDLTVQVSPDLMDVPELPVPLELKETKEQLETQVHLETLVNVEMLAPQVPQDELDKREREETLVPLDPPDLKEMLDQLDSEDPQEHLVPEEALALPEALEVPVKMLLVDRRESPALLEPPVEMETTELPETLEAQEAMDLPDVLFQDHLDPLEDPVPKEMLVHEDPLDLLVSEVSKVSVDLLAPDLESKTAPPEQKELEDHLEHQEQLLITSN